MAELGADRKVRYVGLYLILLRRVRQQYYRFFSYKVLDPLECLLLLCPLLELDVLLRQVIQRSYDVAVVLDEHPIEVSEPYESSYLYYISRYRPRLNSLDLS